MRYSWDSVWNIALAVDLRQNRNARRHRLHNCILANFASQQMLLGTTYQSATRVMSGRIWSCNLILSASGAAIMVRRNCTLSSQRRRKAFNFRVRISSSKHTKLHLSLIAPGISRCSLSLWGSSSLQCCVQASWHRKTLILPPQNLTQPQFHRRLLTALPAMSWSVKDASLKR